MMWFALQTMSTHAQSSGEVFDELSLITIAPYISDQIENLPSAAEVNLESKLNEIVMANGVGGSLFNSRFVITPNVTVMSKNIVPSAPPRVALNLHVNLYVGDGFEGTRFASTSVNVKGVGANENKAYISAFNQIRASSPEIRELLSAAKNRIVDYYNTNCDLIIREAELAASTNNLNLSLSMLASIPKVNMECYEKASERIVPVYLKKINRDCQVQLSAAQNAWNTGRSYEAALQAMKHLQRIEPDAGCYEEARLLSTNIGNHMREVEDREWDLLLKVQQDDVDLQRAAIDAARAVGVSHGDNQPQNVTYNVRGWW